jgi:hypothetical protein
MRAFGIDISTWQGDYPLARAKSEGVEFVIARAGYRSTKYHTLNTDDQWEANYAKAKECGLPVGSYFYSVAMNEAEAVEEADYFARLLNGKKLDLPVYMDVEESQVFALGARAVTDIIKAFCDRMESLGYWVGVYSSGSFFSSYMVEGEIVGRYALWVAQWSDSLTYYADEAGMWQFGGETNTIRDKTVAGQTVDQNYMLVDYPSKIKAAGRNGYGGGETVKEVQTVTAQERLIATARGQVGYHANSNKVNKYAAALDSMGDIYNGAKNGFDWCDVFADWCFVETFGKDKAVRMLNQPKYGCGAGCSFSADYFRSAGRFSRTPSLGAQIFFDWGGDGEEDHVGIVVGFDGSTVYTVEGNTGGGGGSVNARSYSRSDWRIVGYGAPDWSVVGGSDSQGSSGGANGAPSGSIDALARDVIAGKYGNGDTRKAALGSKYDEVQQRVNELLGGGGSASSNYDVDALARDVIAGKYGNGDARKAALGARYDEVQARVNEMLGAGGASSNYDVDALARAVIRGDYGNGDARRKALGARYEAVQRRVNELLS